MVCGNVYKGKTNFLGCIYMVILRRRKSKYGIFKAVKGGVVDVDKMCKTV